MNVSTVGCAFTMLMENKNTIFVDGQKHRWEKMNIK